MSHSSPRRLGRVLAFLGLLVSASLAWAASPTVEVKPYRGRPMLHINGTPVSLPIYSPVGFDRAHFLQAIPWFTPQKMGAYFLFVPYVQGDGWAATAFWHGDAISATPAPAKYGRDSVSFDEQVTFISERDPEAYFFVRGIPNEPPASWLALHKDQLFVTEDGQPLANAPSLASERYWTDLARAAKATITYVEAQPWANRVLGYWSGMFGEGTYWPLYQYYLYDHSPLMTAKWRAFLRERYGTVAALRAAYQDPALTFETITVPKDPLLGPQRQMAAQLYWQPAAVNQARRDYLTLIGRLVRDGYAQIMRASAEATGGKKPVLHDAVKLPMLGWNLLGFFDPAQSWWPAYPEMMSGGGYLEMARLFDTPGFDGLVTPHDYQVRGVGGVYQPEGLADSMVLRGKLFLCEMDLRTYQNPPLDYGAARDDAEYAAISWRNFADSFTRGYQSYWMDLCGKNEGWFGNASLQKLITRQVAVIRESREWPHADVPGIAVILDDSAVLETNGAGNYLNEAVMWEVKQGLARCGVPYRIYLLEDLALPNFPHHRVFYFPNLFKVDDARLQLLQAKVLRDGNVVVWGPGSGISDGQDISTASAAKLTGFAFEPLVPSNLPRRTLVTHFAHPLTKGLPADTIIGSPLAYGPGLYPKDGVVLGAAWTKQGRNYAGLAVKSIGRGARGAMAPGVVPGPGDWASVFTTSLPLPASLWRNAARFAGAHVYTESNDLLLADSTIVALHSIQSGPKTLTLPGAYRVWDVVSGRELGKRLRAITFTLTAPETRVFRLEQVR
jgi:hypothetical protein